MDYKQFARAADWDKILPEAPAPSTVVHMDRMQKSAQYVASWNDFRSQFRVGVGAEIPMADGSTFKVEDIFEAAVVVKGAAHHFGWDLRDIEKDKAVNYGSFGAIGDGVLIPSTITVGSAPVVLDSSFTDEEKALIPLEEKYFDQKLAGPSGMTLNGKVFETIKDAYDDNEAVLLVGPPGCGKTEGVRHLAAKVKRPFRSINLTGNTTTDDIIGRWVLRARDVQGKDGSVAMAPETIWVDGVLVQAMRRGWIVVMDEINGAEDSVLFCLRSLLDGRRSITLTEKDGEVVTAHPNFRLYATMNPSEDGIYGGTHELNAADMERFPKVVYVNYLPEGQEVKCINDKSGNPNATLVKLMVKFANKVRDAFGKSDGVMSIISTRQLIDWSRACLRKDAQTAFIQSIYWKLRPGDRESILDMFTAIFGSS
jgi:cobaltochelatase CobS